MTVKKLRGACEVERAQNKVILAAGALVIYRRLHPDGAGPASSEAARLLAVLDAAWGELEGTTLALVDATLTRISAL